MNTVSPLRKSLLAMTAAAALVLAACGAPDNPPVVEPPPPPDGIEATPDEENPFEGGEGDAPADEPGMTDDEAGEVAVTVSAFEYGYELSSNTFPAGTYTFQLENMGAMGHDMVIEGPGVDESTPVIAPGETASLTVTLEPGFYEIWCSVPGHRGDGMEVTIEVT